MNDNGTEKHALSQIIDSKMDRQKKGYTVKQKISVKGEKVWETETLRRLKIRIKWETGKFLNKIKQTNRQGKKHKT
jgi:hypothetical protein